MRMILFFQWISGEKSGTDVSLWMLAIITD